MKKKVLFSLICLLIFLSIGQVSLAAIEIVPSKDGTGTDQIVNTTVSNSYMQCRAMKEYGGSLYGTTVEPHLATNKDWGAVSYLSNSIYGTNTAGKNTGVTVTIDGVNYYSTTTNITGVMNWGSNPNEKVYTHTSSIILSGTTETDNIKALYQATNTNEEKIFVDTEATKGMALGETNGMFAGSYYGNANSYPVIIRYRLWNYTYGAYGQNYGAFSYYSNGSAGNDLTFRPVIWN